MSIGLGIETDGDFGFMFGRCLGLVKIHRIRIPNKRAAEFCIWKAKNCLPDVVSGTNHIEEEFVSVQDFERFILPELDKYVKLRNDEIKASLKMFKEETHKFLVKGNNLELINDMISNMKFGMKETGSYL